MATSSSSKKISGDTRNNWLTMMFVTHNSYICFRKQTNIDACLKDFKECEKFCFELGELGFTEHHVNIRMDSYIKVLYTGNIDYPKTT